MTTYEDARWESRLPYFENNETWSLINFLSWSMVFATLKRKSNEGEVIIDAGNNPFYVSEHGKVLK
ncbi:14211_t:CDS:2 [Gigaspora rosea]|nr:14211_t:CDS:2 [Gigaspora rosea]